MNGGNKRALEMQKMKIVFFTIDAASDVRLYSGQSKGQSIVLTFSTPRGLISPQLGHGNVIVTEMIWLDWAQYDGGKRLP